MNDRVTMAWRAVVALLSCKLSVPDVTWTQGIRITRVHVYDLFRLVISAISIRLYFRTF